jgi:hypothetical protein
MPERLRLHTEFAQHYTARLHAYQEHLRQRGDAWAQPEHAGLLLFVPGHFRHVVLGPVAVTLAREARRLGVGFVAVQAGNLTGLAFHAGDYTGVEQVRRAYAGPLSF